MKTRIRIVKQGVDHVELQFDDESAADVVADEAHKVDIKPVIGQRQGSEMTGRHYVVRHGVAQDIVTSLNKNPKFELISN